ncbi:MAG: oligosaccharide flippase family protein [Myxococcales bacterium]
MKAPPHTLPSDGTPAPASKAELATSIARDAPDGSPSGDIAHAARSGAVQVLTVAAQALLTVSHVLLARLFGRAVFGSYQASLAILEVVTRAGNAGTAGGMLRYVAGHQARGETHLVRSALGTGLRLCASVCGSFVVLLMLFSAQIAQISHEPRMTTALRVMAPAALFNGCMWVLVQASLASKVTRANFIVRGLAEPMFLLGAGLTAALFGRSLLHLAVAHLVAVVATFVLAVVVVGPIFGPGELRQSLRAPWLPGFARFSLPLGVAELLNAVLQRADIVLLTMFVGTSAAGVYAASEFITRVIANARSVFDSVAAPMFSEALHLNQRQRLRQNLVLMTRWVATAAAPIAVSVLVLRHELLSLYGSGFQEGAAALAALALGNLVNSTCGLSGWILVVGGRSRLMLANNLVAAAVNIAMGLTLIPRIGLLGTAIAALGSVTLLQLLVAIEVWLVYRVHAFAWSLAKPFLAAAATCGVELLVARQIPLTAVRVPALIAAGLVTYMLCLLLLGLEPEDRRLAVKMTGRVRRWWGRSPR